VVPTTVAEDGNVNYDLLVGGADGLVIQRLHRIT
jgi:hypothetical protein